jgi:hypothetical protein
MMPDMVDALQLGQRLERLALLVLTGEYRAAGKVAYDDLERLVDLAMADRPAPTRTLSVVTIERVNDWFRPRDDAANDYLDTLVTWDVDQTMSDFTNSLSRYYVVSDHKGSDGRWSFVCVGRRPDDDEDICFAIEARPARPDPPSGK